MATRQYIGARYVPLFADPIEWDSTREYEPLTIVTYHGDSFTSRRAIPRGTNIHDESYWAPTGNWNAQTEAYRREVRTFDGRITANAEAIAAEVIDRQNAVADEAAARQAADTQLQNNIGSEAAARQAADQVLDTKIDDQVDLLDGRIDDEAAARQTADNQLQANINAEATARQAADNQLQNNIDGEATARQNADSQLRSDLSASIHEADVARYNGDLALDNRINTLRRSFERVSVRSVQDFGAVGDGVHDDTQAFYEAIGEEGDPSEYNIVIIPAGVYRLTEWIYLHSNLHILGPGHVVNDCTQGGIFNWVCQNNDNNKLKNCIIDGVEISSASYTVAGASYRRDNAAIQFYHGATGDNRCENVVVRNCYIHDVGWAGISVYSGYGTGGGVNHSPMEILIEGNKIKNVGVNSYGGTMGVGIHVLGSSARVIGNYVWNCNAECLTFDDGCFQCIAANNIFQKGAGAGVVSCDEGEALIFTGNHFKSFNSSTPCLRLNCGSGPVGEVTISGNVFQYGDSGVSLGNDNSGYAATYVAISGNTFGGHSNQPIWCANNSRFSAAGNWANWNTNDAEYIVNNGLLVSDKLLDIKYGGA